VTTNRAHLLHRYESAVAGAPSWRASFLCPTTTASVADTAISDASRALVEGHLEAVTTGFTTGNTKRHNPCTTHSHRARST
jgi:hypothetical protein